MSDGRKPAGGEGGGCGKNGKTHENFLRFMSFAN